MELTVVMDSLQVVFSVVWRLFSLWCMYCMFDSARRRVLIDVIAFGLGCICAVLWSM